MSTTAVNITKAQGWVNLGACPLTAEVQNTANVLVVFDTAAPSASRITGHKVPTPRINDPLFSANFQGQNVYARVDPKSIVDKAELVVSK